MRNFRKKVGPKKALYYSGHDRWANEKDDVRSLLTHLLCVSRCSDHQKHYYFGWGEGTGARRTTRGPKGAGLARFAPAEDRSPGVYLKHQSRGLYRGSPLAWTGRRYFWEPLAKSGRRGAGIERGTGRPHWSTISGIKGPAAMANRPGDPGSMNADQTTNPNPHTSPFLRPRIPSCLPPLPSTPSLFSLL